MLNENPTTNSFVSIETKTINDESVNTVNARDLHEKLGSKQRFADWIKDRLERFVENQDFIKIESREVAENQINHNFMINQENQGFSNNRLGAGRKPIDYFLTLDTAKSICMLENNPQGDKIRQYFIACEKQLKEKNQSNQYKLPQNYKEALLELVNRVEENEKLQNKIQQDKPKVLFANTVTGSKDSILIGGLAKILKQKGVDIGQNRLFELFREKGYLGKSGNNYNLPTQKAMDLELFEITESVVNLPDKEPKIRSTTKVTGKGQIYFINKFLAGKVQQSLPL